MKIAYVPARAFAMPLNNPSYPPGPYRFYDREYFVIEYLMLIRLRDSLLIPNGDANNGRR